MTHDVVVTQFGVVAPIGTTAAEFEKRMFAGDSGVVDIRGSLVSKNFPVPYGAIVDQSTVPAAEALGVDGGFVTPAQRYTLHALNQVLDKLSAAISIDGIVDGNPAGIFFESVQRSLVTLDPARFSWDEIRAEATAEIMAARLKETGHGEIPPRRQIIVNTACAAGSQAIGLAYRFLRHGRMNRCIVSATDASPWESQLMNFHLLQALMVDDVPAPTASRPFSASRGGFVKGEAAAVLLLETREAAEARGAEILAEVCGYGFTSDAFRLTDGREDNLCVVKAMESAIADAGIGPDAIDYINAHGTATPQNDRLETRAIKRVFGERAYRMPVSSLKSQIGHATVASGAVEAIASILMLQRQRVAPTINLTDHDPECDLDYVPEGSREVCMRYALSNSFGFGGQNACLVFKRGEI